MKYILILILITISTVFLGFNTPLNIDDNPKTFPYDLKIHNIDGDLIDLNKFRGKHMLFVNVASYCGFTSQYESLEKLSQKYDDKLVIIGFPSNQFGNQEPGTHEEISNFCKKNYGVTFLLTEKINVKGDNIHPIYNWLTSSKLNGVKDSNVKWNFQKYFVDNKGNLVDFFYSTTNPLNSKITNLIK